MAAFVPTTVPEVRFLHTLERDGALHWYRAISLLRKLHSYFER